MNSPTAPQPKPSTESCIFVRPKTRNCIAIPRYSTLMFAALMIGPHFSISAFWNAPSASGVCCSGG